MDESFHDSHSISKEAIQALMLRSDSPARLTFAIQYALLLSSAILVVLAPSLHWPGWLMLPGMLVYAVMVLPMFAIVHESGHNTAFASRPLNRLAIWLAGTPIYYTPTLFRAFHFAHHRHTHEPGKDPEISMAGKPAPAVVSHLAFYTSFVTGQPLMLFKFAMVVAGALGSQAVWSGILFFVLPRDRQQVIWESRLVLAFHILWISAGILYLPGLLYLLLAQAFGHFLLILCLTGEHNGLPHQGSMLARTRTTLTLPLVRWLMWNMPYHAEHHAYPAVPWHALPRLHQLLLPELEHIEPGYFAFHRRVLRSLLKGQAFEDKTSRLHPTEESMSEPS